MTNNIGGTFFKIFKIVLNLLIFNKNLAKFQIWTNLVQIQASFNFAYFFLKIYQIHNFPTRHILRCNFAPSGLVLFFSLYCFVVCVKQWFLSVVGHFKDSWFCTAQQVYILVPGFKVCNAAWSGTIYIYAEHLQKDESWQCSWLHSTPAGLPIYHQCQCQCMQLWEERYRLYST